MSERLKNARKHTAEGDLTKAWYLVRIAVERLYTLVRARNDQDFDPETWRNMTAEDMWERGVGALVTSVVPEAPGRLKEILVSTTQGAHDKTATSETDLVDAVKYVASLLTPLRLGAG